MSVLLLVVVLESEWKRYSSLQSDKKTLAFEYEFSLNKKFFHLIEQWEMNVIDLISFEYITMNKLWDILIAWEKATWRQIVPDCSASSLLLEITQTEQSWSSGITGSVGLMTTWP